MQLTHFPFSIRSLVAVNLFVCVLAAIVFTVMLLAGAVSTAEGQPTGTQVAGQVEFALIEPDVTVVPDIVIDTEVSSVTIVRRP